MHTEPFFDEATSTLTYVVHDGVNGAVIDPVWDFDPKAARTSLAGAEKVAGYIDRHRLTITYVIDTHAHADHLTGLAFFARRYGAKTVTGKRIGAIQARFRAFYNLGAEFPADGSQFDLLLDEGETLRVGTLEVRAMHTPGHTPAHMSWLIDDALFLGDTLFAPDYGSARCDFPGGSASELYDSIQRIYALPERTRLLLCHDYRPGSRPMRWETTVGEQKASNVQIDARTTREEFIAFRTTRDAELSAPALILPALQVNIRAGRLPEPEADGVSYLKLPVDRLGAGAAQERQ